MQLRPTPKNPFLLLFFLLALTGCQKCKVEVIWDRHEAIQITQALRWHPNTAPELECMIPGSRLGFQVKATDKDILKQRCKDECVNQQGDHHFVLPDTTRIRWNKVNGAGDFQQNEGETVFYKIRNNTGVDTLNYVIDTPGDKATDDTTITGTFTVTATLNAQTGCLAVSVQAQNPNRPTHITEFQDSTAPICRAQRPQWTTDVAITGTVGISNPLCPRSTVLLSSHFGDKDKVKLVCDVSHCDVGELEKKYSDVLTATWNDGGAGGTFPFGNTGTQVLYKVPDRPQPITFQVSVDDSGNQFNDRAATKRKASPSTMRFDLTAVNSTATGRFRENVTTGRQFSFEPIWNPANADVRKIKWETHLGGADGEVERKKCTTARMTSEAARLRFNNQRNNRELRVSWRTHSHTHGDKELEVAHAWAQQCGDACYCDDNSWGASNFLTGNDHKDFQLFFDRDENGDDGRIENLSTVNAHDSWGERTTLRGVRNIPNWYLHWASDTYNASPHDYDIATPQLKYRGGVRWLGLYDHNNQTVYLGEDSADNSTRAAFQPAGLYINSRDVYANFNTSSQRGYTLVGHQLVSKVYLHEMAHFEAITQNWAPGGAWTTAYGAYSTTDTRISQWNIQGVNIQAALAGTGNFGQQLAGRDVAQKFTVTITFRYRDAAGVIRAGTSGAIANAWLPSHPRLRRAATVIPAGIFTVETATEKWVYRNAQLTRYRKANDPDKDFIPNAIEDQIGSSFRLRGTHRGHTRFNPPTGVSRVNYMADQEYWADHKVIGNGTWGLTNAQWRDRVQPGRHTHDWANPGAQSNPPAR